MGSDLGKYDQVHARRHRHLPWHHYQVPATYNEVAAWTPRLGTCDAQRDNDNDAQLDRINVFFSRGLDGK
jgi:hypothetical protein